MSQGCPAPRLASANPPPAVATLVGHNLAFVHGRLAFDAYRLGKTLQTLSLIFALRSAGIVRARGRQSLWSQAGHGGGGGGGGGGVVVGKVLLVTPASLTSTPGTLPLHPPNPSLNSAPSTNTITRTLTRRA